MTGSPGIEVTGSAVRRAPLMRWIRPGLDSRSMRPVSNESGRRQQAPSTAHEDAVPIAPSRNRSEMPYSVPDDSGLGRSIQIDPITMFCVTQILDGVILARQARDTRRGDRARCSTRTTAC